MATLDDTRAQTRLELAIDAERQRLSQAHAVQKCLYEVLLYADAEDAILYADVAHVVAALMEDVLEKLDLVNIRRAMEESEPRGQ